MIQSQYTIHLCLYITVCIIVSEKIKRSKTKRKVKNREKDIIRW